MGESKGYIRIADEKGSINISEEVIVVIAATAAMEVDGVHSLFFAHGKEPANLLSKKVLSKGVKLSIEENDVTIDVNIIASIGYSINEVGVDIQRAVSSAIEATMGVKIKSVNINICGVSLKSCK